MSPGAESHTDSLGHPFLAGTLPACLSCFPFEFWGGAAWAGGRLLQGDATGRVGGLGLEGH